jgi:hypothetical protein
MQASRQHNTAVIAGFVGYAVVLATAVMFFSSPQINQEQARKAALAAAAEGRRYIGKIIIPDEIAGRCRYLEFNNVTGAFREGATIQCDYASFDADSAPTRFDAIRDAFSKR